MLEQNLTRDEARRRAQILDVASYAVSLDLTTGDKTFRSTSTVHFGCREPGATTFLELIADRVESIELNGATVALASFEGGRIALPSLATDNELRVVADCLYVNTGEGLHRFVDPVDSEVYLYSQFETYDAHRVFACFDQPDLKATFTFDVVAPAHWEVISNMATTGSPAEQGASRHWTYKTSPVMATYINAIIAGPYHVERDRHGEIDLGIFCRTSLAQYLDADEIFTITKQGFDYFHEAFDYPYAFGKYDQLFVPEFNAGAMENAGAVTFLEDYVFRSKVTCFAYERRAETILHEMAHMWFGDLVTMRWWDDLWLNESFATYASVLAQSKATKFVHAWTTFANVEKTWAYRQDQLPSTHPIVAEIEDIAAVEVNFDGITYAKGASVLKQLVSWVGEDAFMQGMRTYFRAHEYGNTELRDLLGALEQASGRDLSAWSKEWLETAGVNTLRPSFSVDGEGVFTSFSVLQEAPPDWPTLRSHRLAIGLFDATPEGLVRRDRIELDVIGAETDVPQLVGVRQPDLVLINDDDLTYTKIRLDERSAATVTSKLGQLPDSLSRALCWAASWDMTRDAELPARQFVQLVLGNIGSETEVGVVQMLLSQTAGSIFNYTDLDYRSTALRSLAQVACDAMQSAESGSDHQLAWARSFIGAARGDDHVAVLNGLLDGTHIVPGLTIDIDLRWSLVRALASLGELPDAGIAAELERDPTAAGRRHASAARASRPSAEAKAEAWTTIMDKPDLPNAILGAWIGGFSNHEQHALLEDYRLRYFERVGDIWANRSSEIAQDIVVGLYPGIFVDQETLDLTDEYLRTQSPPPPLRRLLIEGRDGVARAMRARAKDAAAS
ncbi:MAG: aminopeptidase N [Mycobacteriales bacterium]